MNTTHTRLTHLHARFEGSVPLNSVLEHRQVEGGGGDGGAVAGVTSVEGHREVIKGPPSRLIGRWCVRTNGHHDGVVVCGERPQRHHLQPPL